MYVYMYRISFTLFYAAFLSLDRRFPMAFAIMKLAYLHNLESTQVTLPRQIGVFITKWSQG